MRREQLGALLEWYRLSKNELLAEFDHRLDNAKNRSEEDIAQSWYNTESEKLVTLFEERTMQDDVVTRYKRMDELKEGLFTIVTDRGCYKSYYRAGAKIFKDVPNEDRILGYIQED